MRKKSKYRPKPVILDPVGYVVAGLQPVSKAKDTMLDAGIKNHGAIEAVRTGNATKDQVNFLIRAINLANALAFLGQGKDWVPELVEAQNALRAASKRPKFLFTGPELQAVNLAMSIHDAQMADPGTTVQLLERAVANLERLEVRGLAERLQFESEEA